MKAFRKTALAVAAVMALLLAACGGEDDEAAELGGPEDIQEAETEDADTTSDEESEGDEQTSTEDVDEAAPEPVTVALPARAAPFLDVFVADAEGFFGTHGVEADIIFTPGPAATIAAMAGDSADVGLPFAEQALAAMEVGAPLKIFGGNFNRVLGTLVAGQDFGGIDELRGSRIASSAPDDVLTLLTAQRLEEEGIERDEYDFIIVPSSEQRYQSLQTGAVGASVLVAPRDIQAMEDGFQQVVEIAEPGIFLAHIGSDRFIEERSEAAQRYLQAIQEAQAWMIQSENRDRAIEILVDVTEVDPAVAELTYDFYIEADAWTTGAEIVEDELRTTLQFLATTGKIFSDDPDLDDYATWSVLEAIEASS
jgi:ABC-type nitrate/sulfonate/bicarbonate transport system substrate-binding protein